MASSDNVFCDAGMFEDGFIAPRVLVPVEPILINLGSPGAALHSLPFRTLGGSVVDHDLLFGVLGHEATLDDIQPFFVLGTRSGRYRLFGFEIPRAAIQEAVLECHATLLELEDLVIEGHPASGNNLFGFVGLASRPLTSVTLSNVDGYWSRFVLEELVLNAPAGLYIDIAHTVVAPVHRGTVTDYSFEGETIVISYGMATRRTRQPMIDVYRDIQARLAREPV